MKATVACPFCQARAAKSCEHLALAAPPGDFVRLCIEKCAAQPQWQQLCQQHKGADFIWLETSFCERFLAPLRWFGDLEYEWRPKANPKARDPFALLWSKDPQRLWWELYDLIANQAETIPTATTATIVRCPVCGKSPLPTECEHLVLHGDDLPTAEVISLFNPQGAWLKLKSAHPTIPDEAAAFLKQYGQHFPSLAGVELHPWGDETFGFGDHYVFIWAKQLETFEQEIGKFVQSH